MKVWYGRLFLVLALGLGLMTGCGGQGGNYVDASLGTLNYGESDLGLVLLVSGVLGEPTPPEGVEVQVKDSQGNTVLSGTMHLPSAGGFSAFLYSEGPAQSGTYTINATFPGGLELNKTVQVDATKRLDLPGPVTVNTSQNSVTVKWNEVQEAVSYAVFLLNNSNVTSNSNRFQYTKDTSITFSDLAPGYYTAVVFAFNADLTRPWSPTRVPPQFNASVSFKGPFPIQ